jgi:hypothetical protein
LESRGSRTPADTLFLTFPFNKSSPENLRSLFLGSSGFF